MAIDYYLKAADLGFPASFYQLGLLYEKGLEVEKDSTKAMECYQKAANLGLPAAFFNLGLLYESSDKKNLSKTIECYRIAADHGFLDAEKKLNELQTDLSNGSQ